MRRHKRDKLKRAYAQGYKAGIYGKSRDVCPYQSELNTREHWLSGWREGRIDIKDGWIHL